MKTKKDIKWLILQAISLTIFIAICGFVLFSYYRNQHKEKPKNQTVVATTPATVAPPPTPTPSPVATTLPVASASSVVPAQPAPVVTKKTPTAGPDLEEPSVNEAFR